MGRDMTVLEPSEGGSVRLPEQPGSLIRLIKARATSIETSIDVGTPAGEQTFTRCMAKADRLAKQSVGQEITVAAYLAHEIELTNDETGEVLPAIRLVLVTPDGTTISTTSTTLIRGWFDAIALMGRNGYAGPWRIRIEAVPARRVGEYLQLAHVGRADAAVPKGKTPKDV